MARSSNPRMNTPQGIMSKTPRCPAETRVNEYPINANAIAPETAATPRMRRPRR